MKPARYHEIEATVREVAEIAFNNCDPDLLPRVLEALRDATQALGQLRSGIAEHRSQRADDRCIEDDDRLYALLEDGIKCDRRVGSKEEMLVNCARFIDNRCEAGGPWKSYVRLEADNKKLRRAVDVLLDEISDLDDDEREAFDEGAVEEAIKLRQEVDLQDGQT